MKCILSRPLKLIKQRAKAHRCIRARGCTRYTAGSAAYKCGGSIRSLLKQMDGLRADCVKQPLSRVWGTSRGGYSRPDLVDAHDLSRDVPQERTRRCSRLCHECESALSESGKLQVDYFADTHTRPRARFRSRERILHARPAKCPFANSRR